MKKFILSLLISVMLLQTFNTNRIASASVLNNLTTEVNTGCYWETVIEDVPSESFILPLTADKTITKTKTSTYKNSKGVALWAVSITATFSYNGSTSKCINCYDKAVAYGKSWSIKSSSCSKSGNSATAYAVATHSNGNKSEDYSETVIIKCNKNGIIS